MRYLIDSPECERIQAGGDYAEEWFDVRKKLSFEEFAMFTEAGDEHASPASQMRKILRIASRLVQAWSLQYDNGAPVPYDPDKFLQLPIEMVYPVAAYINSESFLTQLSALKNQKS